MKTLDELLLLWHDGSITTEDLADLKARLSSAEARARLVEEFMTTAVILDTLKADAAAGDLRHAPTPLRLPSDRRPRPQIYWAAAAVLLIAVGASLWRWSREPQSLARLEQIAGQVFVITADARPIAASGTELFSGQGLEVVGEDSSAVVVYADGTRLELEGDAVITEFSGGGATGKRVVLAAGALRADVAKQPPGLPMTLTTPGAEVVVLGTKFDLSSGGESTHVETQEGSVRLTRASDGRSVEVPAGFEGIAGAATAPGAQPSPPRFHQSRFSALGYYRTTALSPDGRTLVTSRFESGSVELWDAASGSKGITIAAHPQPVNATAFFADGRTLATAGLDHTIRLWDIATGESIAVFEGPEQLLALALCDDGESLLALSGHPQQEKTLTSWNLQTHERRVDPQTYRGEAWVLASNGRWLATAVSKGSSVTVWNVFPGRERAVLQKFSARVICMAFSPDGSRLAVSDMSGLVTLWDVAAAQIQQTFRPAGQTVQGLTFSADGARLAMGQRHATVRLWDAATGKQQAILEGAVKPGSTATVRPMFFSPDGKTLATTESHDNGTVRLWSVPAN